MILALWLGCAEDVFPGRTYICAEDDELVIMNDGPLQLAELAVGRTSRCGLYATGPDLVNGRGDYEQVETAEIWDQRDIELRWGPASVGRGEMTTLSLLGLGIVTPNPGRLQRFEGQYLVECSSCEVRVDGLDDVQIDAQDDDVMVLACNSSGELFGDAGTVAYLDQGDWIGSGAGGQIFATEETSVNIHSAWRAEPVDRVPSCSY